RFPLQSEMCRRARKPRRRIGYTPLFLRPRQRSFQRPLGASFVSLASEVAAIQIAPMPPATRPVARFLFALPAHPHLELPDALTKGIAAVQVERRLAG